MIGLDPSELLKLNNPGQRAAYDALRRAAAHARERAIQLNTGIVIERDGRQVFLSAADLRRERQASGGGARYSSEGCAPVATIVAAALLSRGRGRLARTAVLPGLSNSSASSTTCSRSQL